jgi:hypothetical protein
MTSKFLVLLILLPGIFFGQQYFRVSADYTVKKKNPDSTFQLSKGRVYYDDIVGKLTYIGRFPERETYVIQDTNMYQFAGDKFVGRSASGVMPKTTVFALILNQSINNYGMENSNYEMTNVEEDNEMTISTWMPPKQFRKQLGKIVIANKSNLLYGVVFYNGEGRMLSKQFYEDYYNVDGIDFPTKIVQFFYTETSEFYQVTTYSNFIVDEKDNDNIYDYPVEQYK